MMWRVSLALSAMIFLAGCASAVTPVNQKPDVASPTQVYLAQVPIEPADDGNKYWFVTIKNNAGEIVYKDEAKEFVADVQIYWVWDSADRLWLYSADSGRVYMWINKDGLWEKSFWGYGRNDRVYKEAIQPPDELFPPYLKVT